jgi:hypothetical protein
MSVRNGDKARYGRLRKHRILLRRRIREMRDGMEDKTTGKHLSRPRNTAQPR